MTTSHWSLQPDPTTKFMPASQYQNGELLRNGDAARGESDGAHGHGTLGGRRARTPPHLTKIRRFPLSVIRASTSARWGFSSKYFSGSRATAR